MRYRRQITKHRSLLALTPEMKFLIEKKTYPKRAASRDIAAPDLQSGEAGEAPSAALQ
jgi:hypothetical protein